MDECIKEAENVSFESNIGESYDKEWALKDQALRDGYEEGKEQGYEDGKEAGIKEGMKEGRRETAKNMLNDNIEIEFISKYTGLSIEEISSL